VPSRPSPGCPPRTPSSQLDNSRRHRGRPIGRTIAGTSRPRLLGGAAPGVPSCTRWELSWELVPGMAGDTRVVTLLFSDVVGVSDPDQQGASLNTRLATLIVEHG